MSNPWGRTGTTTSSSWAEQAEEEDERLAAAAAAKSAAKSTSSSSTAADPSSFPSLKEAATKPKKKKTVLSLSEFNLSTTTKSGSSVRLTPAEMMQLPTGPKIRSADPQFDSSESNWGRRSSYGGFDDDRRGPGPRRGTDEAQMPSRADEVDNWAREKRFSAPPPTSGVDSGRVNRYESLGMGSRADDVDNWAIGKKPVEQLVPRSSGFGTGSRDSGYDSDRWRRGGDVRESGGDGGGGVRQRLVLEPRKVVDVAPVVAVVSQPSRGNPFGAARPREEVLAEKGLDWKKLDLDIDAKKSSSRPTSSQGSRPSSVHSNRSEGTGVGVEQVSVKPRPKVNPFGDAKPREVVLEQKGKDWRKMDLELEHRGVERAETEEEKALKQEIEHLKQELSNYTSQGSSADQSILRDQISSREKELELLIRELDDKVPFGPKAVERPGSAASRPGSSASRPGSAAGRPGSGAGRYGGFSDRPPSQSGSSEDLRGVEFMDRPRTRGTDIWTRPGEDRKGGFYGNRDRGFMGNEGPRSRERW